ncbi:MAG TPA: FecR domain-containing protein [Bacteriovoracaceae bacterium]|nr:FecR domain-containing protein [Bacteriovoracaceae bacterium]
MMKYILLSLLIVVQAFGQDLAFDKATGQAVPKYVGQVKIMKGKVFKQKGQGKPERIEIGARFFKDETLITEEKSFAKLLVVDDTEMTIGPNTSLNFEEFKFVSKTDRQIVYSLTMGQLAAFIKNKAKQNDIVFKTKNAVMGVRGTQILMNHRMVKNIEISEFALESGSASVTDKIKQVTHDLTKDQRLIVLKDAVSNESITERNSLSPDEIKMLEGEDSFLPYFAPHDAQPGSTLYGFLQGETKSSDSDDFHKLDKKETKPTGSFQNLKKLNEKLKEDRRKK